MFYVQRAVGVAYLIGSGIHIGIVATDPQSYRGFGSHALAPIRDGWAHIFMSAPAFWGLAVAAGELSIGLLLLSSGRQAQAGIAGAIAFHLCLLMFGWWAWPYALPALAVLTLLRRHLFQPGAEPSGRVTGHIDPLQGGSHERQHN
jgi:hypothetical protein